MTEKPWLDIGPLDPRIRADSGLLLVLHRITTRGVLPEQVEGLTDELLQRYLAVVRKRAGLHRRHRYADCLWVEREALHMLTTSSPSDPFIREMQRALDDLVAKSYDGEAEKILRDAIEGREKLISEAQGNRRRGNGKLNALQREVVQILKRNMNQTWLDVLDTLERRAGKGLVKAVDGTSKEGVIVFEPEATGRSKNSWSIATLPNIVGKIKQKIRSGEL